MKNLFLKITAFAVINLLMLPAAFAVTIEGGENVFLNDPILDDAYVIGGNANVKSDVFGDLYIAGGSVVIDGNVHEDLVIGGGRVVVLGNVFGDLRIVGGQAAIYGNVSDDLVVLGGQVDVGPDSVIGGSILTGAGVLTVDGIVNEDIRGGVGMLILNGSVGRDVIVTVEDTLNISEESTIGGDLKYSAFISANIPEGVVGGQTLFNAFEHEKVVESFQFTFTRKIFGYIASLLLTLIFVLFIPKYLTRAGSTVAENTFKCFGIGLLATIIALIGSIILMLTLVGVPFGLIILASYLIAMYIAKIVVAAWAISYIMNFKKKVSKVKLFGMMACALLAYYLLGMIPFVGWLITLVLFLTGVGGIILTEGYYFKFLKDKKAL